MVWQFCNSISYTKTKNPVGQKLKMLPKQPPERVNTFGGNNCCYSIGSIMIDVIKN
jgi:hypothetical protein